MRKDNKMDIILIIVCGILTIIGIATKDIIYAVTGVGLLNAYLLVMIYVKINK